jgi:hypothetical protein
MAWSLSKSALVLGAIHGNYDRDARAWRLGALMIHCGTCLVHHA